MDNLFNDTEDSSDRSEESKVLHLVPSRFQDLSGAEAFVLAVMSVCGAIRGKSNIYDLVRLVARYYPPIDHKCLDNKMLKGVVDSLLFSRVIDIISNDYMPTSDSIFGVPHKALSDVEFEQAMLAAFEREHYSYSWSIPTHIIRFCLLTKRKSIGNAQLDLIRHSGGLRELLILIQEQKDLSFVDLMFYQSVNFDEVPQITSLIINCFPGDDRFVTQTVQWFLDMNDTSKNYAFYPFVSYLALCGTPEQIETVANSYGEHLRPQYKNLVAVSFVADMLRGDLSLARKKAELFKEAWHDLQGKKRKWLPQAMGSFYALLLFIGDSSADKKTALTYLRSTIKEFKDARLTESIACELSELLLSYFVQKGSGNRVEFAYQFYNPIFMTFWINIILKWENSNSGFRFVEDESLALNERYNLEMRNCGIFPSCDDKKSSEELKNLLCEQLGMKPLSQLIEPKPDWEEIFSVFEDYADVKQASDDQVNERIVWRVNFENKHIVPYYQKRQRKGWSKGRNMALRTLHATTPQYATKTDVQLINNIKRVEAWRGVDYEWDFEKCLPHFVNHSLLFTTQDPMLPVALVEEQVELIVNEKRDKITLKLTRDLRNRVIKEGKNKYKYLTWDDGIYHTAKLMRNKGVKSLQIPIEQKDRITKALIGYSTRVSVKGDFDDPNLLKKSGKSDLVVRIQPIGDELNASVLVKPLSEDALRLIPGVGNAILSHRSPKGDRIQIKRSLKKEQQALQELKNVIPSFAGMGDNEMTFVEEVDTLNFLAEMRELAPKVELTWPKGESLKVAKVATMSDFNVGVKSNIDWFELSGKVAVDNEKLWSIKQLMEASAGGSKQFVKLDDNTYFKLTKALQKRLSELSSISVLKGDNLRVHRLGASALNTIVEDAGTSRTDKKWKDNLKNIENLRHFSPEIPSNLQAELRPYQIEGYNWLARLHAWGVGACLADDMGLGKTIQAVALMLKQANDGPCLVIAPSSVCPNWHKEIARFAPVLHSVGLGLQKRNESIKDLKAFDVLIVSYGIIQSNPDLLSEREWNIVVLDEAHAIKNANSMRSKAAMKLQAKCKIITTGTPIQNHLGELWNLFQFINPGFLGSYESFNERFVNGSSQSEISAKRKALNHYIQPFILRRNKRDVLDDLPAKTEMTLTVEQSEDEKALYEVMRQKALENIEQSEEVGGAAHMQILAQISKLRLASCNPRLVDAGSNLTSSKMSALEELVDNLLEASHKALVFSQFTKHLALIREMLDAKGISYQYLDGSSTSKQREKSIVDFQSGKSDLFLISLKAGGVGLNLTAADYVIHMDPWWNPAVEDQASDRAHRIGQTRPVTVYRLVAEGTIEEKIVKLHHAKRGLADDLLAGTDKSAKVSASELFDLMR